MTVYRYKIKEVRQEREDALLAIIDMGMLGDSDPLWVPRNVINDKMQIDSSWLEKKGL